jgi:hypothetical protein
MGLFIGVCSIERVTNDNTIDKWHDNVLQTAVATAVIFAVPFIFQGEKTCEQKRMNAKYTQYWHTFESLTKAWTYSNAVLPLGK